MYNSNSPSFHLFYRNQSAYVHFFSKIIIQGLIAGVYFAMLQARRFTYPTREGSVCMEEGGGLDPEGYKLMMGWLL